MRRFRINKLGLGNIRGDLSGGLTAAVVALPLAIAFGVASGAGPVAGIYGAVCVGFFAALFGGTPAQISGPTGPMTIIFASVFTLYAGEPVLAFTVVIMAGLFQILFGLFKLGGLVNLMPYPVISGFMTGIGCILIIMQVEPLLGYASPATVTSALSVLPHQLSEPNWDAVMLGLSAFLICVALPRRLGRIIPAPLLAILVVSPLALVFDGATTIGQIPSGLPDWQLPQISFERLDNMLVSAVVLAALGSVDSLLTSLAADNVTRTYHDSDKELVGQGIGNLVAGLAGGIPGAGATIRTMANAQAGGRTPVSGISHAIVLLAVVLGLGAGVSMIPHAVLAGILLKVGVDVIDWRYLKRMTRAPAVDMGLMMVVLLLTVLVDIITAVGAGIVLASLVFVKETAKDQIESIRTLSDPDHARFLNPEETRVFRSCKGQLMYLHLSGSMSFGAANEMTRRFSMVASYEVLILDLLDVPKLDGSAALALEEIIDRARTASKAVVITGLGPQVARLLGRMGILDELKKTDRFHTRLEALKFAAHLVEQRQLDAG